MMERDVGRVRSFRAFQNRAFRLYWGGQVVSLTGTWMQTVAQSWLVYRLTSSPLALGGVNFVSLLPLLPLALIGGSLADRFSKRNLLVLTSTNAMLQALVLTILSWTGKIQIWHIMLLAFVLGAGNILESGARQSFIAEVVDEDDLTSAIALSTSSWNVARIVGPAIAGLLVAAVGETWCFSINSLSYLAVIISLLLIRTEQRGDKIGSFSMVGDLKEMACYFWNEPGITSVMALVALSAFCVLSFTILLPVFAVDVLSTGAPGLGWLMTAVGIGAVIGALGVASVDRKYGRGRLFIIGQLTAPFFLLFFALSRNYLISWLILLGLGIVLIGQNVLGNALLQTMAPVGLRGRVMSIYGLSFTGMTRFGGLALGAMAEQTGAPLALGASAVISLVGCGLILRKVPSVIKSP